MLFNWLFVVCVCVCSAGEAFYKNIQKYVLSEEELEENGYPFPDPEEKGKAIVKKVLIHPIELPI